MTVPSGQRLAGRTVVVTGAARGMGSARGDDVSTLAGVSSVYGLVGTAGYLAYCASKGAVTVMTRSAAVTHGPDGIRVNSIHPGVVFTEMLEQELAGLGPDSLEDFLQATPLRRGARPDEISRCVAFLASDDSSFVTGAEIVVDGGLMAGR